MTSTWQCLCRNHLWPRTSTPSYHY